MSEWKKGNIAKCCDISTGFPFKGEKYSSTGSLRVVRGENVTVGSLRWDSEKYWNYPIDEIKNLLLEENDIVIGMDGSKVGHNRSKIKSVDLPLILAQRVARLRAKSGTNQDFIWYQIFDNRFKEYVESIHTGTSIPHISMSQIGDYEISAPTLNEQKDIASVLSSLDNKIDLLHRQNKTLEALAETLFRQWFVEDDQGDCNGVELGEVIETTSGGTPSRSKMEQYESGTINWVKSKELNGSYIIDTEEKITEDALKNSSAKLLPINSILIAMYGATVGEYAIIEREMSCNQAICALKPNDKYPYTFLFMYAKVHKNELINMAVGSAQQNISQQLIQQLLVPSCHDKTKEFHVVVEPWFKKIKNNIIQIRTLEKLRDTLLPKLMSGEVRVAV